MEKITKTCPYCGEEIMPSAIKCKHCGEWLNKEPALKDQISRDNADEKTVTESQSAKPVPAANECVGTTEDGENAKYGFFELYLDMTWKGLDIKKPNWWVANWAFIPALNFNSTISRRRFWFASLLIGFSYGYITITMLDIAYTLSSPIFVKMLFWLLWAMTLLKSIELQVRRLRDTGKSPWLVLLNLVPIIGWIILMIMYCRKGSDSPRAKWKTKDTIGVVLLIFTIIIVEAVIPSLLLQIIY